MDTRHETRRGGLAVLLLLAALIPVVVVGVLATSRNGTGDPRREAQIKPSVMPQAASISVPRPALPGGLSAAVTAAAAQGRRSSGTGSSLWMALASLAAGALIVLGAFIHERMKQRPPAFAGAPALQAR